MIKEGLIVAIFLMVLGLALVIHDGVNELKRIADVIVMDSKGLSFSQEPQRVIVTCAAPRAAHHASEWDKAAVPYDPTARAAPQSLTPDPGIELGGAK